MIHLFVELGDHNRFDDGQQFGHGERRHAERVTERECGRHVPADHCAGQDTQLAAEARALMNTLTDVARRIESDPARFLLDGRVPDYRR
jgi:hypothetical protein